jgi:hypothetical protein
MILLHDVSYARLLSRRRTTGKYDSVNAVQSVVMTCGRQDDGSTRYAETNHMVLVQRSMCEGWFLFDNTDDPSPKLACSRKINDSDYYSNYY